MGKAGGISRRRQRFLFDFVAVSVISTSLLCHVSTAGEDDSIMAKFAESISPKPPGWTGTDPCKWTGIDCDSSGRVSSISIPSKSLSGELPSDLSQLSNLKILNLQHNQFSGAAPSLTNLGNLQSVFFNDNNFTSVPSSFLSGLKNLQTFHISENPSIAPWTLPESLTDSSSLSTIFAARCGLTGTIPDIFGSFPNIQNIRLGYNNLTGPLPPSLANSGVQNLLVNDQDAGLSGWIDMIGTMSQLSQAWLHGNKFTGPIPDVSKCESLFDLQLRNNLLTGVIPPSLASLPKLVNVSLQNNKFQGPVPSFPTNVQVNLGNTNKFCNPSPGPCDSQVTILLEIASALSYPMTLAEAWEGNNPCKSWNFITCDSSGSVIVINFGKQYWGGTISPSISKLTALKTLLLNDNKLNGTIPKSLTTLPQLTLIDITNNNISGKIPEFPSRVTLKTSGNPFIGIDLNGGGGLSMVAWVMIGLGGSALIVLLVFGFIMYKRSRNRVGQYVRRKNDSEFDIDGGGMSDYGLISSRVPSQNSNDTSDFQVYDGGSFTFSIEVLRHATSHFREDNILGKGGFGVVYKGTLHDGTEIAVKRMEAAGAESTKGTNEFKAEIEVLSKVRHKNLVALLGSCVNGSERLLIYEYMPKGTLSQHLFEPVASPLKWKQRVTIALDVARGIEYLHTLAQQSFIHRDLKPSNILLGDDMRAKVSDFGLVKSAPDGKYSVETRLAGTFGYLAPEYATTGRVTTKIDVFAYGVVLMEIMTGRKALDENLPDEQCHLVSWFRRVIVNKGNIREHLDPNLVIDEETFDSISKVAELAGHCTAREPANRPDMGHVVNVLSPLVQQWRPKRPEEEDSFGIDLRMSLPQALQRWQDDVSISTINTDLYSNTKSFK